MIFTPSEYREASHINALRSMLSIKKPCSMCPMSFLDKVPGGDTYCSVCKSFIGVDRKSGLCPCHYFGPGECIRRTYLKLEEIGVI